MLVGCIKYIFVALVGVFVVCAARAQCCECEENDGCGLGETNDGNLEYPDCHQCYYGTDCGFCNYCTGFTDCPEGAPAGRKCKQIQENCGDITECTKYELCNPNNGASGTYWASSGVCHVEGSTCYANERACSLFDVSADYGQWSCQKSHQTGNARWRPGENAWDTSDCQCSMTNMNIDTTLGTTVKCQNANATYRVTDAYKYRTATVTDSVYYIPARRYCAQCYPGYIPHTVSPFSTWYDGGEIHSLIQYPNGVGGLYGVVVCDNLVPAPYYADGCVIDWTKSSGPAAQNACKMSCDAGMETIENGATGANYCGPGGTTYTDATGTFRIGSNSGACN